jgi:hypothetical protein
LLRAAHSWIEKFTDHFMNMNMYYFHLLPSALAHTECTRKLLKDKNLVMLKDQKKRNPVTPPM